MVVVNPNLTIVPFAERSEAHGPRREIVVVGGTNTHTITLDLGANGYIDSWKFDGTELLNRADAGVRGIQPSACFPGLEEGEFQKHHLCQGGDILSMPGATFSGTRYVWGPGNPTYVIEKPGYQGGTIIEVGFTPAEFDPDGVLSGLGYCSGHGGSRLERVQWSAYSMVQRLWVNYRGNENIHFLQTALMLPEDRVAAWFDVDLYSAVFGREDLFSRVIAYDAASTTETVLSTGTTGANYQADNRYYLMDRTSRWGDDEGAYDTSVITSGKGGIGMAGATDNDLALGVCANLSPDVVLGADRSLRELKDCNAFFWSQNREGTESTGYDGTQTVMIGATSTLTNRLHLRSAIRRIPAGGVWSSRFLCTGTWTEVKALMDTVVSQRMNDPEH